MQARDLLAEDGSDLSDLELEVSWRLFVVLTFKRKKIRILD